MALLCICLLLRGLSSPSIPLPLLVAALQSHRSPTAAPSERQDVMQKVTEAAI